MKKYLMLFSDDVRFTRMLELELTDIGVETVSDFSNSVGERYIIIDLDTVSPENIGIYSGITKIIGFSKKNTEEIGDLSNICDDILQRPFYTRDLLQLFGYSDSERKGIRKVKLEKREPAQIRLEIDSNNKAAIWGDTVIVLSDNEYAVLALLYQNIGETVERASIDMLLGCEGSNMGDVYICHLRRKIDNKLGLKLIYTVRGRGYMLKNH